MKTSKTAYIVSKKFLICLIRKIYSTLLFLYIHYFIIRKIHLRTPIALVVLTNDFAITPLVVSFVGS